MSVPVNQGGLQGVGERPEESGRSHVVAIMLAQHLSYAEFRHVARLCRSIDLSRLPAGFDFKQYLLRVLRAGAASTAATVARLSDEEVDLLRAELAEFQALVS